MGTRGDWEQVARRRIVSVLTRRVLCSQRQLESKISEAGPAPQRAQPISVTDGLKALRGANRVRVALEAGAAHGIGVELYSLPTFDESVEAHRERLALIRETYPIYTQTAGSDELCAKVLERIVHSSLDSCSSFEVVHSEVEVGRPKSIQAGNVTIDNAAPFDHVARHIESGILVAVEDKNIRQWMYPDNQVEPLRIFIGKAARNGLLPILIARKLPYVTRLLFRRIGILGFETHHQYFHPSVAETMALVRHKDGIGFHDIQFTLDPNPHLVGFLERLSPLTISEYHRTFIEQRDTMVAFASGDLGFYKFLEAIGMPWGWLDEQAYDYEGP